MTHWYDCNALCTALAALYLLILIGTVLKLGGMLIEVLRKRVKINSYNGNYIYKFERRNENDKLWKH